MSNLFMMNLRYLLLCGIGVCGSVLLGHGAAVAADLDAVWVVDMQRVMNTSVAGKAARNTLEADAKKAELALEAQRSEVLRIREQLEKQAALLSRQAIQEKRETLAEKERDLARALSDQREELLRKNQAQIGKVVEAAREVVAELAARDGKKLIIEKDARAVLFVNEHYDLTDEVVAALDRKKIAL